MEKPNFEIVKDQAHRSFIEYIWKRIEREDAAAKRIHDKDIGEYVHRLTNKLMWQSQLNIYMAALNNEIPGEWNMLHWDFVEHNSNPSGSDGPFVNRIPVSA